MIPLALIALVTLSGCVRVQAALALSEDDLVSGQIVIAALPGKQGDSGPALTIAPELKGKVRTQIYSADGYVGQTVSFQGLSFAEITVLSDTISGGKQYRVGFRRAGDLVTVSGSVDLTELPADRSDVQIKISFPGSVTRTNGVNDNGTVTWKPKAGAVTEFDATVQYTDQSGVSWSKWVAIVGASALGVSLLVLALAFFSHRRSVRLAGPPTVSRF
ncbi:LppM family (lipo)protein [Actinokineospora inagensis]|uniref:LppM family (lipo)protein n=1 Tax=Actinokineospora inagensis TaxID=103730 RepID=UPI000411476C|nr:DUF3153 domain-containing protein [Actinokineospora inagensis]